MTGDHHGRTATRATLPVTATDEILGTHSCAGHGEHPHRADAAQTDIVTGLVRLSFLVQGIYTRVSERHDLTPVQAKLLCTVAQGNRGMTDLADFFGVERAALTGLVDRVEHRGLAERTSVPGAARGGD